MRASILEISSQYVAFYYQFGCQLTSGVCSYALCANTAVDPTMHIRPQAKPDSLFSGKKHHYWRPTSPTLNLFTFTIRNVSGKCIRLLVTPCSRDFNAIDRTSYTSVAATSSDASHWLQYSTQYSA